MSNKLEVYLTALFCIVLVMIGFSFLTPSLHDIYYQKWFQISLVLCAIVFFIIFVFRLQKSKRNQNS